MQNTGNTLVQWIPERKGVNEPVSPAAGDVTHQTGGLPRHLAGIDMENGIRRAGGDRILYASQLNYFVADHGSDHRKIRDALDRDDRESALHTAHTLKGVAGGLGAQTLYESAKAVESAIRNDPPRIDASVKRLSTDLCEVVEDLQAKMPNQAAVESEPIEPCQVDSQHIMSLMDDLQDLFKEMDPDAEKIVLEISRLLLDPSYVSLCNKLLEQAADLEFDAANLTLAELRRSFSNRGLSPEKSTP